MKTKRIYARVCPKRDTTENWSKHPFFVPLKGEFIIYTDKTVIEEEGKTLIIPGVKVGDGVSYIKDLPFLGDESKYVQATDYNDLKNKPKIGGVTLEGDMSPEDIGLQPAGDYPERPLTAEDIDKIIDEANASDSGE